jgi:nitroimidazol reductase NimA-like FMN-containing flavoprotein (pyridoxamine 5'-phosphate oxidase superfamily)
VDTFTDDRDWRSVVMYGLYTELPDTPGTQHDREQAWSFLQEHANWWEPGALKPTSQSMTNSPTHLFYRISIESITGRQSFSQ